MDMSELLHTALLGLPPAKVGKVREVYDLGDELLIIATDRISAFDAVMANGIPDKGVILNKMSAFWFELFSDVCPNHIVSTDDNEIQAKLQSPHPELYGRSTLARKAQPLPIECVARGYITGSLYKEYLSAGGQNDHVEVNGLQFAPGLLNSSPLPEPIFTPATKAQEGHDENISFTKAIDLVGKEVAEFVQAKTLEIFARASAHAAERGILLADTKFEFGLTDDGVIWIDEALTPDSSRFWEAAAYAPGRSQDSFDKQFVRDYLEFSGWDKTPPGPFLPADVVAKTRTKYIDAYRRLTDRNDL